MLTPDDLHALRSFRSEQNPVVSLYLHIAKGTPDEGKYLLNLKNLLTDLESRRDQWTSAQWDSVSQDIARIREFVRDAYAGGATDLCVFACHGDNLWRTFALSYAVPTRLHVHNHAQVKPLLRLLEKYSPSCTTLVDQNRARIFLVHGDQLEERLDMVGGVPGRHDQGGWAQARLQRQHDQAVLHHLKSTAEEIFKIYQDEPFDGLILGGTDEIISQFRELLHPYLRERVWDTFPVEMMINIRELSDQVQAVTKRARHDEHQNLLQQLRDGLGTGTKAVAGLEPTVSALQKGQVQTLLVPVGFRQEGARCAKCNALTSEERETCGYCGGDLVAVPDVVEDLLQQAFDQGCRICSPEGDVADELNAEGGIGALLRYAS